MSDAQLVSVVITTRNRSALLERAVRSALSQTYRNLEVIVVDDGSLPATALRISDARLRLIRLDQSRGGAAARNIGFSNSHGEFVCLLDDDDEYLPEKIERQLCFLNAHPKVDLVFSRVRVNGPGERQSENLPDGYIHTASLNFRYFNVIHTNSTLFRRRVIESVAFDTRLTKYQDTQFYLEACRQFNVAFLPETVAVWNRDNRADQVSVGNATRNYRNFSIICEIFKDTIKTDLRLRFRYYGRLAYQALRCCDISGFCRAILGMLCPQNVRGAGSLRDLGAHWISSDEQVPRQDLERRATILQRRHEGAR